MRNHLNIHNEKAYRLKPIRKLRLSIIVVNITRDRYMKSCAKLHQASICDFTMVLLYICVG